MEDPTTSAIADLIDRRAVAEQQILISIFGDCARGVNIAALAGISDKSFTDPACRVLWEVAVRVGTIGATREQMANAAYRIIRQECPRPNLIEWIAEIVGSDIPIDQLTRGDAEKLADIDRRIDRFQELQEEMSRTLDLDEPLPKPATSTAVPSIPRIVTRPNAGRASR
jgi:hypothetical protein